MATPVGGGGEYTLGGLSQEKKVPQHAKKTDLVFKRTQEEGRSVQSSGSPSLKEKPHVELLEGSFDYNEASIPSAPARELAEEVEDVARDSFGGSHVAPEEVLEGKMKAFVKEQDTSGLLGLFKNAANHREKAQFLAILAKLVKDNKDSYFLEDLEKLIQRESNAPNSVAKDISEARMDAHVLHISQAIQANDLDKLKQHLESLDATMCLSDKFLQRMQAALGSEYPEFSQILHQFPDIFKQAQAENRRVKPEQLFSQLLLKTMASCIFLDKISEASTYEDMEASMKVALTRGVAVFSQLRAFAKEIVSPEMQANLLRFCDAKQAEYEKNMKKRLSTILEGLVTDPCASTGELHAFIDEAKNNGLNPYALLQGVRVQDKGAKLYVQRLLSKFTSLLTASYGVDKLNPYELLRITCVAEYRLHCLPPSSAATQLKATDPEVNLPRSLLLDPANHTFTIICGEHGLVKGEGAEGKVRSVLVVGEEAIAAVRKTPKQHFGTNPRVFDATELKYARRFMKIGTLVEYTKGRITKQSLTMEQFTTDFESLLDKGPAAFGSEAEMFQSFDQILATLERAHAQNIVHGDLKPSNILYKMGKAQLADWGFAHQINNPEEPARINRNATLSYASPVDLLRNDAQISPEEWKAMDMFALGMVFAIYISACERAQNRGEGLWASAVLPPWGLLLRSHLPGGKKLDFTKDVQAVQKSLEKVNHPLARLAASLLTTEPGKMPSAAKAREMLKQQAASRRTFK